MKLVLGYGETQESSSTIGVGHLFSRPARPPPPQGGAEGGAAGHQTKGDAAGHWTKGGAVKHSRKQQERRRSSTATARKRRGAAAWTRRDGRGSAGGAELVGGSCGAVPASLLPEIPSISTCVGWKASTSLGKVIVAVRWWLEGGDHTKVTT